jgi:hypothetical protein
MHINILTPSHGIGLRRSTRLLASVLRDSGCRVTVTVFHADLGARVGRAIRKAGSTLLRRPLYDVNIFVESAAASWFPLARVNCLVPNPEWADDEVVESLPGFDWVLCKTRHAEEIFSKLGCRTRYIGFTSFDRLDPTVSRDYGRFLHVAGRSHMKGSDVLIRTWLQHPEWPLLTVLWHADGVQPTYASNLRWIPRWIDETSLLTLQNSHAVHFCPSIVEGFGHSIVEAMSVRAVVVTTDGPPMNTLVNTERGILVSSVMTRPLRLGTCYDVDEASIEQAIRQILSLTMSERRRMGEEARLWFVENDLMFRGQLFNLLRECTGVETRSARLADRGLQNRVGRQAV